MNLMLPPPPVGGPIRTRRVAAVSTNMMLFTLPFAFATVAEPPSTISFTIGPGRYLMCPPLELTSSVLTAKARNAYARREPNDQRAEDLPAPPTEWYRDLVSWARFFRDQAVCQCGHTRGEHRARPIRRIMRLLRDHPDACTACPCRNFQLARG